MTYPLSFVVVSLRVAIVIFQVEVDHESFLAARSSFIASGGISTCLYRSVISTISEVADVLRLFICEVTVACINPQLFSVYK